MFTFLILNYKTSDVTIKLVRDILKRFKKDDINVVVVDNDSKDGSFEAITAAFDFSENIYVLATDKNLGYANGNNFGFRFIKENLKSDGFVIVMNSDLEFTQSDIFQTIDTEYKISHFSVLGPDIFVPETKVHHNPKKMHIYTNDQVQQIQKKNLDLLNSEFKLRMHAYLKTFSWLRGFVLRVRNKRVTPNTNLKSKAYNAILHGSFLVFSPLFVKKYEELFDNRTFFYFETELLGLKLAESGEISVYTPDIQMIHHQNTATKKAFDNELNKTRFQVKNMVNSTQVYLDEINNM